MFSALLEVSAKLYSPELPLVKLRSEYHGWCGCEEK